jgi:hypothetical protein
MRLICASCAHLWNTRSSMSIAPTAASVCAAVDEIVPHVDGAAMHALMWVNSCAYRVFEDGHVGDLEDLREAAGSLLETTPCNARARALVERLSDMVRHMDMQ